MNRRNVIKAAIGAALVPVAALPKSSEDAKRELLLEIGSLGLSDREQHEMMMLVMAVSEGSRVGNQRAVAVGELRSGLPTTEVYERAQARAHKQCEKILAAKRA